MKGATAFTGIKFQLGKVRQGCVCVCNMCLVGQ
jgi:hypothetical protein